MEGAVHVLVIMKGRPNSAYKLYKWHLPKITFDLQIMNAKEILLQESHTTAMYDFWLV